MRRWWWSAASGSVAPSCLLHETSLPVEGAILVDGRWKTVDLRPFRSVSIQISMRLT